MIERIAHCKFPYLRPLLLALRTVADITVSFRQFKQAAARAPGNLQVITSKLGDNGSGRHPCWRIKKKKVA